MSTKQTQLEIYISGRVQGVFLRRTLATVASILGFKGYIENLADGRVHAVAHGERGRLDELVKWCQRGTLLSKIDGLTYSFSEVKGKEEFTGFEVRGDKGGLLKDKLHALRNLGRNVLKEDTQLNVPKHIVIIPDGNRRWARAQGWKPWVGHQKASSPQKAMEICAEGARLGVKYVTFWGFSTENWSRDEQEVNAIFQVVSDNFEGFLAECQKREIRFHHIGRKDRLPEKVVKNLERLVEETKHFDKFHLQLALDYGGKDELLRAVRKIKESDVHGQEIDEKLLRSYLDSDSEIPDPDLIIRTSGEQRTSGVLLSQSDYAELYFTDVYFPDFTAEHLRLAILDYSYRTRRFGGTASTDLTGIDESKLIEPQAGEAALQPQ